VAEFLQGSFLGESFGFGGERFAAVVGTWRLVPGDLELFAGLEGGPCGVGEDGDAGEMAEKIVGAGEREGVAHAGDFFDVVEIGAGDFAAEARGANVHGVEQAGEFLVDAEERLAGDEFFVIYAADTTAEKLEILRVLERDGFQIGRRQGGGLGDEFAVGQLAARGAVNDSGGFGETLGRGDFPRLRGSFDQRDASGGAEPAALVVVDWNGGAAAGELPAEPRIEAGLFDDDAFPRRFEFFGDDHGQGRFHALADLGIFRDDRDDALRCDADKSVGRELACRGHGFSGIGRETDRRRFQVQGEGDAAAGEGAEFEETAAVEAAGGVGRAGGGERSFDEVGKTCAHLAASWI
jgi:hypothetical protein